jgi:hypothetical protein
MSEETTITDEQAQALHEIEAYWRERIAQEILEKGKYLHQGANAVYRRCADIARNGK